MAQNKSRPISKSSGTSLLHLSSHEMSISGNSSSPQTTEASCPYHCPCGRPVIIASPPPTSIPAATERTLCQMLKRELRVFGENTTLRGVPRIVKARSRRLRTTWLFFVLLLIAGCFICIRYLTLQYLEYNVIHPPRVLRDARSPFPSVTLCNLRPISPNGTKVMQKQNWKTPRQFAAAVNKFATFNLYYKGRQLDYNKATAAFSLAGFLESLPNEKDRRSFGYLRDDFVIKCQVTYLNGSKRVASPCDRVGKWRHFIHAQYLNCYIFDLKYDIRNTTKTVEIYLYLDEALNSTMCPACFHGDVKSQLSGAVIAVHKPDTFPEINDKSINLMPGSLTEIRLRTIINIQKTPPYGHCKPDTPKTVYLYGRDYAYSESACRHLTIQKDIISKCHCQAIEYPYDPTTTNISDTHRVIPFCSRMSNYVSIDQCNSTMNATDSDPVCLEDLEHLINLTRCKMSVTQKYLQDVVPSCKVPCDFFSYETDRSTSTWPTKSWQLPWLNSHYSKKKENFYKRKEFEPYHRAKYLLDRGNISQAQEILGRTEVLERNLLAVLINRPNFNLHKVEEKEVLSLTSFLSQIGGLFSIWIGLTMISVVEVLELLIHSVLAIGRACGFRSLNTNNDVVMCNNNGKANSARKKKKRKSNATKSNNSKLRKQNIYETQADVEKLSIMVNSNVVNDTVDHLQDFRHRTTSKWDSSSVPSGVERSSNTFGFSSDDFSRGYHYTLDSDYLQGTRTDVETML